MDSNAVVTYVMVFLAVLVPYLAFSFCMRSPQLDGGTPPKSLPPVFRLFWRHIRAVSAEFGQTFAVRHPGLERKYRSIVLMSGYQLTAEELFASQIFVSVAAGMVFGLGFFVLGGMAGPALGLTFLSALLGWVYPRMIVEKRAKQRQMEIVKSLPFAIDLLVSAMRAGLDFLAAVRYYVKMGGSGALAVEFGMLLKQMEMGKSRLEALEEMAAHVQTPEFSAFVGAVAHGTEIGASIIDTLQIQGEDMRRARFSLAEEKAARAPALMIFPIAVFILPSVFTIIFVPVALRFMAAKGM